MTQRSKKNLVWVEVRPGKQRLVDLSAQRPQKNTSYAAVHDVNRFSDGRFKFNTYGLNDKGDIPCIEDLADDKGKEQWPDYVVLPDGREGPRPFRSHEEFRQYSKLTGLVDSEKSTASRRQRRR